MSTTIEEISKNYNEAIFDTDKVRALKIIHDAIDKGVSPEDIIFKIIIASIDSMSSLAKTLIETNLAQHFMTSLIAEEVIEELLPRFTKRPSIIGVL